MAKTKKTTTPKVVEHEPATPSLLYVIEVIYKSGRTSQFTDVTSTNTTCGEDPAQVPYYDYMLVQQADRNSTYVNMSEVEELTVGVQNNGQ